MPYFFGKISIISPQEVDQTIVTSWGRHSSPLFTRTPEIDEVAECHLVQIFDACFDLL